MTTNLSTLALARGILEELDEDLIVLALPGTEYRLHLVPTVPPGEFGISVGKRIKGTIHAQALRMHTARAGGCFVEPMWGEPRIVQGSVRAVDEQANRVLVDVSVPMWVTVQEGQQASEFREGQMVNFHVRSGARFRPDSS